jgi:hypothetical protein
MKLFWDLRIDPQFSMTSSGAWLPYGKHNLGGCEMQPGRRRWADHQELIRSTAPPIAEEPAG